uniref:Serine/threonine-protein phosphatase PGAM5, mitochondrial n=2 Tax=Macrostomum lignano TaxID=282301 RepID=A0A1I8H891_9PLAT
NFQSIPSANQVQFPVQMASVLRKCAALFGTAAAFGVYRYCQRRLEDGHSHLSDGLRLLWDWPARWNSNWDDVGTGLGGIGGILSLLRQRGLVGAAAEQSRFSRHLLLVRHAQYEQECLTALGREQASLTGQRLRELNVRFRALRYSTMTRARETAEAILRHLPQGLDVEPCRLLEEGAPVPPEPPAANYQPPPETFTQDGRRIESAFRRFFHRAAPDQQSDSYELLVCHANVIRYFVCRALQLPPEAWLRFSLDHASITWVTIRPSGRVAVRYVGNSGHIPADKCTYL